MSIFRIYFSVKSQLTVNYTTSFILMMEVLLHLMIRYFCLLSDFKSIISMQILSRYSIYTLHFVFSKIPLIIYFLLNYLLSKTKHNKIHYIYSHMCANIFFLHNISIIVDFQFSQCISEFNLLFTSCSPISPVTS